MSTGSNDFINLYNIDPIIQAMYTPAQYEDLLISALSGYIQVSRPETSLILSVQTILEMSSQLQSSIKQTNPSIHQQSTNSHSKTSPTACLHNQCLLHMFLSGKLG